MSSQITQKTNPWEDVPATDVFEVAARPSSTACCPVGGRSHQYLVIEGQAGFGAENGECSVSVLPMAEEDLTKLLLDHVASELERVDADRNDAHCLGDLSVDEIAMIPDRPTGLSAFMLTCETIADPNAFASKSRALEIFVNLRDRKPIASFALGTVQAAPQAVSAFLISLVQKLDGGETTNDAHDTVRP